MTEQLRDNIVNYEKRAFAFNELTVPTAELRRVFRELDALFKKTQLSKTMTILFDKGIMTIKAQTNIVYEAHPIAMSYENGDKFEVSVVFRNISDLLPRDGLTKLEVTNQHVKFFSDSTSYTFTVEDALVPTVPEDDNDSSGTKIETKTLRESVRIISKLLPFAALYKRKSIYLFAGNFVQVRLPSLWVEAKNTGLVLTLSTELTSLLYEFLSDVLTVEIKQNNSWTVINKGLSKIYIPMKGDESIQSIAELMPGLNFIGSYTVKGVDEKVKLLTRALGKSDAEFYACTNGLKISVRTEKTDIEYNSASDVGEMLDRFKIRLELLNGIMAIIGSEFKLYSQGIYRCLETDNVKILITTS